MGRFPGAGAIAFPAGVAVGTGVGGAISSAIAPRVRQIENQAWNIFQTMPLQAVEAAQLVADGEREMTWGLAEAKNVGVNDERFQALVDMIDTAPDLGLLYDMFRRGMIGEAAFRRGAKRHSIEDEWLDNLVALRARILSPAEAANAWQQGYMSEGEATDEAALSGVSAQRALVQRQLAGLPPGPETGLAMLRRGIITEAEFEQMIVEGNTKRKYADEYLAIRDNVTRADTAAGLWLRGWIDEAEAKRIGRLTGYGDEEMDHLYLNRGRPATTRQVHIGWQRGGRLAGAANEREAFEKSVRQSNIRTEYTDLLWAQRYTYPSAFVLRALAQDGTFDRATTERILIEAGWNPEYAELAAAKWAGAEEEGPSTKWADRAKSRLFTVAHNEYLDESIDEARARADLAAVGASAAEQDTIITLWNREREIQRLELTPAQIRKAYKKGVYTEAQALAELDERGMTPEDADTFLQTG